MAKSKNHTNHNQNRKAHRNGIKKPANHRFTSNRGMSHAFLRNQRWAKSKNPNRTEQIKHEKEVNHKRNEKLKLQRIQKKTEAKAAAPAAVAAVVVKKVETKQKKQTTTTRKLIFQKGDSKHFKALQKKRDAKLTKKHNKPKATKEKNNILGQKTSKKNNILNQKTSQDDNNSKKKEGKRVEWR